MVTPTKTDKTTTIFQLLEFNKIILTVTIAKIVKYNKAAAKAFDSCQKYIYLLQSQK